MKLEKPTKLRIGLCASLVVLAIVMGFVLRDFVGPETQMWQRLVFIGAVPGSVLAALFVALIGPVGVLIGYGGVFAMALPTALPEPWNRYFSFLYIGGLLAWTAFRKRKAAKQQGNEEDAATGPITDDPDEFKIGYTGKSLVLVQQTTNGRFFQLIRYGNTLHCYRNGGELRGADLQKLKTDERIVYPLGKDDFSIQLDTVERIRIKELDNSSAGYDCLAIVKTRKRSYRFAPTYYMERQDFLDFWRQLLPDVTNTPAETLASEEAKPDTGRLGILKKVITGYYVYIALVSLCWLFLEVPYDLFAVLALIAFPALFVLYLRFPGELSMLENTKHIGKQSIMLPMMYSGFALLLRFLMDYNIRNWGRYFVLVGIAAAVMLAVFFVFSREWKSRKTVIFYYVFVLLFYISGAVGQVNAVLDFSEPVLEQGSIVDMRISTSSKSPDSYYIDVQTADAEVLELKISKSAYETLEPGDDVTVCTYSGFLGIPYSYGVVP